MTAKCVKPRSADVDSAIVGVASGEEGALERLYALVGSAVYAYALSLTKNVYDAQDVLHDTLIKVYESAPNYTSQGKPMAWIITIAKNLCYGKFRQQRTVNLTEEELDRQLGSTSNSSVEDRLVVSKCLSELSEEERIAVVLHAVAGLKHREIAKHLNIPLATELSKYNRALEKLKLKIQGGQDEKNRT